MNPHRADIDGLRAIAILSVVAYHTELPLFPGGFVGVDVFFVISGYVITRMLLDEIRRTGTISLLTFYARRARRLMPAFFLVALVTLIAGLVLIPTAQERVHLLQTGLAATVFLSNVFLWRNTNYFDGPAETKPLLHTWSLAVEEQFYLVWPFLLLALIPLLRRTQYRPGTALLAAVATFAALGVAAYVLVARIDPQAAFYLVPTRAWELALGIFLALLEPRLRQSGRGAAELLILLGLGGIVLAVVWLDDVAARIGVHLLLPTLATAAVILGGSLHGATVGARLLTNRPMVFVGKLSYSWYLWHWPVLALMRVTHVGDGAPVLSATLGITLSFGLAWLAYATFEHPIRAHQPGPYRTRGGTFAASGALMAVLLLLGGGALLANRGGLEEPGAGAALWPQELRKRQEDCRASYPFSGGLPPAQHCAFGATDTTIELAVWGDSHADHMIPAIAHFAQGSGGTVLQRAMAGCPPLFGVVPGKEGYGPLLGCDRFNEAVFEELQALKQQGLQGVVLSARWALYFGRPSLLATEERYWLDAGERDLERLEALFEQRLGATLDRIAALGLRVILVAPMPELAFDAKECVAREGDAAAGARCKTPRADWERHRAASQRIIDAAAPRYPWLRVWDPSALFCDAEFCYAKRSEKYRLFSDNNHISRMAAVEMATQGREILQWLLPAAERAP
jgi:peptidoglycan/LPS O-acetylase OafA/YrhL